MRRWNWTLVAGLVALAVAGCETDETEMRDGAVAEERAADEGVEPVQLDTLAWFREGGTLEFDGMRWIVAGDPLWDPMVERVGEYEGTPLYAELGAGPPYAALYVPLEGDYWQRLEPAGSTPPTESERATEGVNIEGIDPRGDPMEGYRDDGTPDEDDEETPPEG